MVKKGEYIIENRFVSISVVALLLLSMVLPLAYASQDAVATDEGYIIDQVQDEIGGYYVEINAEYAAAQSFIPTMTPLAKVRLMMLSNNPSNPGQDYPLKVSIRSVVDGEDLTSVQVTKEKFESDYTWVNIDFEDITVQPGMPYYIVAETTAPGASYWWAMYSSEDIDKYEAGEAWLRFVDGGVVRWSNFTEKSDFCFKTYSYTGKICDLECRGTIGLPDQVPGSTATVSFTIENIGDPESLLNWEIASCPEWGNWSFSPNHGFDLTPEDGQLEIMVEIGIPAEKNADFTGEIVIANTFDPSDSDSVPVMVSTPKGKHSFGSLFDLLPMPLQQLFYLLF